MNNYLSSIILVSIGVGIIQLIAPQYKEIDKYIKVIGILAILYVMLSPIISFINDIDLNFIEDLKDKIEISDEEKQDEYNEILKKYINEHSIKECKSKIKEILEKEFQIPADECEIEISTQIIDDSISISTVQILLSGNSIFKNPYNIEDYIHTLLKCTCQVLIK